MGTMIITEENFKERVEEAQKPVMLDFYASWCGPCKMLAPVIEDFAVEELRVWVGKVNIEEEQELAKRYQIQTVPTILILYQGKVYGRQSGFQTKEALEDMTRKALSNIQGEQP